MTTLAAEITVPTALDVTVTKDLLTVSLADGRLVSVPLAWYPRLLHANAKERSNWRLIGRGEGIHWPDIEDDIRVDGLVACRRSMESPASLKRWLASRQTKTT